MISPIVFYEDYQEFYSRHKGGNDLFAFRPGGIVILMDIPYNNEPDNIKFSMHLESKTYFIESVNHYASREQFVDHVSQNYPDHFQWMLFNVAL